MGKFRKHQKHSANSDDSKYQNTIDFMSKPQSFKKPFKAKDKFAGKKNFGKSFSKSPGPFSKFRKQNHGNVDGADNPSKNQFNKGKLKRKMKLVDGDSSPNKKANQQGHENAESEVTTQHNDKNNKSTKNSEGDKTDAKNKIIFMKKKERKLLRKKSAMKKNVGSYDRATKLKMLWETLRKENCKEPQKSEVVAECVKLLKGHVQEVAFAHDTVRVIECVYGFANVDQRATIFEELKDSITTLAKSKYGKFFLTKVLRCGSKEQKNHIMSQFYSNVISLMRHTEAATVVEVAFNECATAAQRAELVQEFYGAEYRFFKSSDCTSLGQLLEKHPEQKVLIIKSMKEALSKVLQKNVIKHSIVHHVLREFMAHADQDSRSEIIELVRSLIVEMLHTKDGSRAAMNCLWNGNVKDRKAIVKSFKMHVVKIAKEEFGHMVLLALFDCVDDTVLVEKHIISELVASCVEVSENLYGRKVLLHLLSPRNSLYFAPDVIKILAQGDGNPYSKKDAKIRSDELRKSVIGPLVSLVANHTQKRYTDNSYCWFVYAVLKNTKGDNVPAFKSLARLAAVEYSTATKNSHIIECSGSHFILKKIIADEKDLSECNGESFAEILAEEASEEVIQSWTLCNRGCFVLKDILDTGFPSVVQKVKAAMNGFHSKLSKKSFVGAEILLKKLKEC